jgi:hypothetical protein
MERGFGRLEGEWALLTLRVRGLERAQPHADLTILANCPAPCEGTPGSTHGVVRLGIPLTQVYRPRWMLLGAIIGIAVVLLLVVVVVWASRTPPNDESTRARDSVGASGRPDP